jgi:hypothetical protein
MYWELYQLLTVLAVACMGVVIVLKTAIIPIGLLGTGLWSILMYQARNIVIYHSGGGSTTVGSPSWQFVALAAALLMLTAVILHYLGVFPPESDSAQPEPDRPSVDRGTPPQEVPSQSS